MRCPNGRRWHRFGVNLPLEWHHRLSDIARRRSMEAKRHIGMGEVIREAVREMLMRESSNG